MRGRYFFGQREVRYRSRNPQYSLVRASRQVELLRRILEQQPTLIVGVAINRELFTMKSCVAGSRAPHLHEPGVFDPGGDDLASFSIYRVRSKNAGWRAQHFDMQIDAIE